MEMKTEKIMNLNDIMDGVDFCVLSGTAFMPVSGITIDSRKVEPGFAFVCQSGLTLDGHDYVDEALKRGAAAIICEKDILSNVTVLKVENTRTAVCLMAKNFYESLKNMNLFGVTGTNGKTSITYYMESIFKAAGISSAVIGTNGANINGNPIGIKYLTSTTPDPVELHQIFKRTEDLGAKFCLMEVTSHALALDKLFGANFEVAVFTNLTQDHMDFHKTMENYLIAKTKLFSMCNYGVVNIDDKASEYILEKASCKIITYGIDNECDYRAFNIKYEIDGCSYDVEINGIVQNFHIKVPGKFSVYNSLSAIVSGLCFSIPVSVIKKGIEEMEGVPGRCQSVPNNKGFGVIVDYAHTPDSLENIIDSVRGFTKGHVITVFGCGGDRDRTKRPIMGRIASELSDYSVITSDNPRSEEPMDIINEVKSGFVTNNYETEPDRKMAIKKAIAMAKPGDTVIIAGKGHENYQELKDKIRISFDDFEVAKEFLD